MPQKVTDANGSRRTLVNVESPEGFDLWREGELWRTAADLIMVPPTGILKSADSLYFQHI
jgi:hypothetical protein